MSTQKQEPKDVDKLIVVIEIPRGYNSGSKSCDDCLFNYRTNRNGINGCTEINCAFGKLMRLHGQNIGYTNPDALISTCNYFDFSKAKINFVSTSKLISNEK